MGRGRFRGRGGGGAGSEQGDGGGGADELAGERGRHQGQGQGRGIGSGRGEGGRKEGRTSVLCGFELSLPTLHFLALSRFTHLPPSHVSTLSTHGLCKVLPSDAPCPRWLAPRPS